MRCLLFFCLDAKERSKEKIKNCVSEAKKSSFIAKRQKLASLKQVCRF